MDQSTGEFWTLHNTFGSELERADLATLRSNSVERVGLKIGQTIGRWVRAESGHDGRPSNEARHTIATMLGGATGPSAFGR